MHNETDFLVCKICNVQTKTKMALPSHIFAHHKIKFEDYLIKFYYDDTRPLCKVCQEKTTYKRGKYIFSEYCPKHANESRREWSKQNGYGAKMNASWKKGLNKSNSPSILAQSQKITGRGNPFFGHKLSDEHKEKLLLSRKEATKISKEEFSARSNDERTSCLSSYEEYVGIIEKNLLFKCERCKKKYTASLLHKSCMSCNREDSAQDFKLSPEEYKIRTTIREDEFAILTPYQDYKNYDSKNLKVKCKKCDIVLDCSLRLLIHGYRCNNCHPYSTQEKEIYDFLSLHRFSVRQGDRDLINPKEIDIVVESEKLAIEFNGLYWHSERYKEKRYHSEKTLACQQKGYQLFHVFSDEWENKKDIVKSMILHRLKKTQNRVYARKCRVSETNIQKEVKDFTDKTHISGHTTFTKAFLLKDEQSRIVCALTLRKPFHKKYSGYIEIARFSSSLNTSVVGGFAKLLKRASAWAKGEGYKGLLSYADLRFGSGGVYKKSGFDMIGNTVIDYWYTDGIQRYNRFRFKAREGKTEKQISNDAKIYRIYGCGSAIYIKAL